MGGIGELWTTLFFEPMLNGLLVIYGFLGHNFALTIVAFTILIRSLMLPLTMKQLHSSKAMTALQPQIKDLQKRYGKNREELSKATMALYKENGVNPAGCAIPTLLQFPIWIGLYQSITLAMADRPDNLFSLGVHMYHWLPTIGLIPLNNSFMWLNLAHPDPIYLLPLLVAGSTWVQQKMMTVPSDDPQQQQMNQMMGYMMPVMMGFFTINFPSGLALYWLTSNIYSMVVQYFVTGWGSLHVRGLTDRPGARRAVLVKVPASALKANSKPRRDPKSADITVDGADIAANGKANGAARTNGRGPRKQPRKPAGQPRR